MNAFAQVKTLGSHLLLAAAACVLAACSGGGSLDQTPHGALSPGQVTTPANLDGLVTAAYSWLGNDHYTDPNFFWPTGNIRGGDAHKGGNGPGDVYYYHALTMYNLITPQGVDINSANRYWVRWYDGVSRVNTALAAINPISTSDYPAKDGRVGELHFLRGALYFWLKIHFDRVPYVDETTAPTAVVSNTAQTSQQLWDTIIADFRAAVASLPATQSQVGRANRYAAEAYLAKTLLYAAYVQDPATHAVTSIDQAKLAEVISLATDIENSGQYGLVADYAQNFLPENDNNFESIFAIQRSVNDVSAQGNGGRGTFSSALNYPVGNSGFGCCGFHIPSQDFINNFKTLNGLPFDSYNGTGPANDYSLANGNLTTQPIDPRLDHSVVMEGKPFKYCTIAGPTCVHDGINWARDPTTYGSTIGEKDLVARDSPFLALNGPFFISAMNTVLIRFADVELFKAEAHVDIVAVSYKGAAPALQDVIAGHVQLMFATSASVIGHIKAGTLRPLAVTTIKRTSLMPELATVAELGLPGFDATTWHGLVAPAGTPKDVVETLHAATVKALADPDTRRALADLGVEIVGGSPAEFSAYIASEIPKWTAVVKASGAQLD